MHINLTNNQPLFLWSQNYTQFIQSGLEREQLRAGPLGLIAYLFFNQETDDWVRVRYRTAGEQVQDK